MCKGAECPYKATCSVPDGDLIIGESCLTETAIIATLLIEYCREFQIDEDNIADIERVRNLIDIEIKLMRCNRLMAVNHELAVTIEDDNGNCVRKLNPIARYDLILIREHGRVLKNLLT